MDVKYTFVIAIFSVFLPEIAHAADPPGPTVTSTNKVASTEPSPPAPSTNDNGPTLGDPSATDRLLATFERRHTMAALEGGIIVLPNAPISAGQKGGSVPFATVGHGDATLQTGLRLLFRGGRDWMIGVGATFGPSPTQDPEYGGTSSLQRTHSRNYLVMTSEARYIPLRFGNVEVWGGVLVGAVIIADRFTTLAGDDVPSIVGTKQVTISTEGFDVGLQLGVTWNFAERWGAGFVVRSNQWILPNTPDCSPIGDCATLSGSLQSFEGGFSIGYRIPL